jgi:GLPGLI family protein
MNTKIILIALVSILFSISISAQKIQGIATYKTDRKVDLKMNAEEMDDAMQQSIAAQLKKQFQREFTLTFNASESLYVQEDEGLSAPNPKPANGISIQLSGNTDVLYRNTKENRFVNETEIMSKAFLVKDSLSALDWKFEKETKNIGEYTCFKATYTREVTEKTFDSNTNEMVEVQKDQVTTAWYTLDIPVQHGPAEFWGLPGLILEISDGDLTILCSKIVLNPAKGIDIKEAIKGTMVSQDEYDIIQKKKTDEMMEQFRNNSNRKSDGPTRIIKIGG